MFYKTAANTPDKNINCCEKERLQMYCATVYAMSGINHMLILQNSKKLPESLESPFSPSNLQHQNLRFYNALYDYTS
jgi:hypothetical protein